MLTLEAVRREPAGLEMTYSVTHSTPGPEGTTVVESLKLLVRQRCYASITIGPADGNTPAEALGKLAIWLRRLADGIEDRRETQLPL